MKALRMRKIWPFVVAIVVTTAHISTSADGFSVIGSDHLRLKGAVVAEIGNAQEVPPPAGTEWKDQVYSLNGRCFTIFGYFGYWGFGDKPAMLVIDQRETIQLAVFESSLGEISLKLNFVHMIQCPEHANIVPSCDGLKSDECMRLLDEYQKKLERKIKELGG